MSEDESAKPYASPASGAADTGTDARPDETTPQSEPQHTLTDETAEADTPLAMKAAALIGNNKGKLAIGAAAMLGIAVFYKWRDSKLAKEDPEEYARLRRIKAGLESGVEGADDVGDLEADSGEAADAGKAEPEKKD